MQQATQSVRKQVFDDFAKKSCSYADCAARTPNRKMRLGLISLFCGLWTAALISRLFSLQISHVDTWQEWAIKQHFAEMQIASERGPVLDRNDKLLAVSVPAGSVYVRPKQVRDKQDTAKKLAVLLDMKPAAVQEKLASSQPFVWLKRQMPRHDAERITALKIAGVGSVVESRRFYPFNQSASALIGKVGIDGNGLSGIEARYETRLHMDHVKTRMTRDAFGNMIQEISDHSDDFELPKGDALHLTLDTDVQLIMDEELEAGRAAANAKRAMAIMIDSDTGEIVAISQSPSYNFNLPQNGASKDALKNLLVESVFEPGSVMKPLMTAAAIEEKLIRPTDKIDCENGHYFFAGHTIKDTHPSGVVTVSDVVIRSSNIGMTKIGVKLGAEREYSYLKRFGFGAPSQLGLAGETSGILRPLASWSKIDVATHAFGQGVAVTPLQMVRALSVIGNGGILPELHVVVDGSERTGERVISDNTAALVREMLYGVVEDEHGTGSKAKIDGLRVGGKTGTAQKANPNGRGYMPGAYVASFIGFVDGTPLGVNKTLTTMVIMDEPHTTSIYGGTLAAPVFKRIVERSLKFLATRSSLSPRQHPAPGILEPGLNKGPDLVQVGFRPGA